MTQEELEKLDKLEAAAQDAWEEDPGSMKSDLLGLAVKLYPTDPLGAKTLTVCAAEVERLRGVVEAQAKVIRAEDVSWELARRYDEGVHAALEHAAFKAREKARAALAALEGKE